MASRQKANDDESMRAAAAAHQAYLQATQARIAAAPPEAQEQMRSAMLECLRPPKMPSL